VSTRLDLLKGAVRDLLHDPDRARETGRRARDAALARYGLERFLDDWDRLLREVT
jgi:glycosyltransferase involved in cell wall biosynthesis